MRHGHRRWLIRAANLDIESAFTTVGHSTNGVAGAKRLEICLAFVLMANTYYERTFVLSIVF